jgi:hypothetical protein
MGSPVFMRVSDDANKSEQGTNRKWNKRTMRTNRTELFVLFAVRVRSGDER